MTDGDNPAYRGPSSGSRHASDLLDRTTTEGAVARPGSELLGDGAFVGPDGGAATAGDDR